MCRHKSLAPLKFAGMLPLPRAGPALPPWMLAPGAGSAREAVLLPVLPRPLASAPWAGVAVLVEHLPELSY